MSSNCTGRGSRYRPEECFVNDRFKSVKSSRVTFWATIHQRVVGDGVEEHVGVAQAEIEIDQGHGVLRVLGEDAAQD